MLRAESLTKRLKIFNFSRAYNHHVISKQTLKTKQNWRVLGLNTLIHALSPAIFASCGDQSFSFRTKRGYKVNSQAYQSRIWYGGFQSVARLSGEAAKTLIYFARSTKTAMLHVRRLLLRRLRKPFRYSQISSKFKQANGYTVMTSLWPDTHMILQVILQAPCIQTDGSARKFVSIWNLTVSRAHVYYF